jgi:surfeit locus 1 family protein
MPGLSFRPALKPTVFTLLGLAILLNLGFWQVRRLHEKERSIALARARLALPPVPLDRALADPARHAWRRVQAEGTYAAAETVLLPERRGERGARVLTPLVVSGLRAADGRQAAILVDRGWLPDREADRYLREEPRAGRVQVVGSLVPLEDEPPFPGSAPRRRRLISFRLGVLRAQISVPLVSALLQRGDARDGDLPKGEWAIPRMRVDHLQYALTWFALAATLAVVFVAAHLKRTS